MKDFDYDVLQKKRIARGAYAKKGGSRSKKCTMPDDYLTNAERKKLSRTVLEVNLKKPMDWETFKSLPTEIKREYLEYLRDECGATSSDISSDMFGKSHDALRKHIKDSEPSLEGIFKKGGVSDSALKERLEKWKAFLSQEPESKDGMYFRTYRIEQTTERPEEVIAVNFMPEETEETQETEETVKPVEILAEEKSAATGFRISSITFTISDCTVDDLRRLFKSLEG